MKRGKKGFAIAVGVLACTIGIVGCSSNGSQETGSPPPKAAESTTPKPTLKALKSFIQEDYNTYPAGKVLEERTGYKVQYDMLPKESPLDKLNLIMASGTDYDLITVADTNTFIKYAQSGALTDLGPLIEKYGPNIKAAIPQTSFDRIKVDGKIYGIPTKSLSHVAGGLLIRQDWLEKLNLKMPTTIDEFTAVLQAFKDKDPGGTGKNGTPFTLSSSIANIPNLIGAFGMPNVNNPVNGKMLNNAENPAYKDYLQFLNDLYKKGLIDNEFGSNKVETTREIFASGRAGMIFANWADIPTLMDTLYKTQPSAKVTYVAPLTGKNGQSGYGIPVGNSGFSIVPKSSKNQEETVKWINEILDKETYKLTMIGKEGVHHTYKDGQYTPILPIFNKELNYGGNFLVGHIEADFPIQWQARVRKDMRLFEGFSQLNNNLADKYKFEDIIGYASGLSVTAANSQKLNQLLNDNAVKFVMGVEDISKLPDFVKKWNTEGGEAMMKEINAWYATYSKK